MIPRFHHCLAIIGRCRCACGPVLACIILIANSSAAELRDLDAHSPFVPPTNLQEWQTRADQLRSQLSISVGQFPRLPLDPVQPQIYGKLQFDGYTIEKVVFESLPGFYVTGNLYKPDPFSNDQSYPGVLCPHGHWRDARFYDESPAERKRLIAIGAERFEAAARNHIQARCVQLARMGCIVFHWDMIGSADSQQISYERAHGFGRDDHRADRNDEGWLLFSAAAESHGQNILALQTLACTRAVDMLLTIPEIDKERIAITGASGGGTQSFIGAAVDERIKVAFPAVMVSTGMQGGCTCENGPWLRVGTGNVEIAGLIAPRPLGMTAADDWTRNMASDGFPELQRLYQLHDAADQVALFPAIHFGHNYNHVSRTSMYGWMNHHFDLGLEAPVLETDFEWVGRQQLTVWDDDHPRPDGGLEFERALTQLWTTINREHLMGMARGDRQQIAELTATLKKGWAVCLGLAIASSPLEELEDDTLETGAFELRSKHLPRWTLRPPPARTHAENQEFGQLASDTPHNHLLQDLWKSSQDDLHFVVEGDDPSSPLRFYPALEGDTRTDKLDSDGEYVYLKAVKQPLVNNPRPAAGYTFGYNPPLFATRAQQLGVSLHWLAKEFPSSHITIRASGAEAALAAAGLFCAQHMGTEVVHADSISLSLAPGDFRFEDAKDIRSPEFLPHSAKFLDFPGLLAALSKTTIRLRGLSSSNADDVRSLARLHAASANRLEMQDDTAH